MKIKPESEISCHNTLTRVISGLFHTRYFTTVVSTRGRVTHSHKVGCRGYPHLLGRVKSRVHQRKVAVKPEKIGKFGRLL